MSNTNEKSHEGLSGKELYELKKKQRDTGKKKEGKTETEKSTSANIVGPIIGVLVFAGLVAVFIWYATQQVYLPPITAQNHTETIPESRILTTPMPDREQRHMLEHSNGSGAPGIIIQYNCNNYDCAPDLVENLVALMEDLPENVYLGPNNYDAKIILTRWGSYEVLDAFDEQAIRDFIEG